MELEMEEKTEKKREEKMKKEEYCIKNVYLYVVFLATLLSHGARAPLLIDLVLNPHCFLCANGSKTHLPLF